MGTLGSFLERRTEREKKVGKAGERGRSRARAKFTAVLGALALLMSLLSEQEAQAQPTLVATIPVPGGNLHGVAVNPNTNRIYVSRWTSSAVAVIDGSTNAVIADVGAAWAGFGVAVNPNTNRIYVSGWFQVSVHDGATNAMVATIPGFSVSTNGVGVNPNTNLIYVSNQNANRVDVIDGATNVVVATIPVGTPGGLGVNPNTNRIYVANLGSNTVSVIAGASNAVVATIPVGVFPHAVGVNPNTNRIYVANGASNDVSVIDCATNAVVATIPVGTPAAVAVNPATDRIYVVNGGSNTVSVIDGGTNAVVATVGVGSNIQSDGIDVNPMTDRVYVVNRGESTVSVIEDLVEITVAIDIKPGIFPNSINPNSKGNITVAILTTSTAQGESLDFDATTVDPTTVLFGPTGTEAAPVHAALEDVDGDGDTDLILHFNTQDTGIVCGDTSASLTGETFGGQMIEGSDSIRTPGCK